MLDHNPRSLAITPSKPNVIVRSYRSGRPVTVTVSTQVARERAFTSVRLEVE